MEFDLIVLALAFLICKFLEASIGRCHLIHADPVPSFSDTSVLQITAPAEHSSIDILHVFKTLVAELEAGLVGTKA